jgi:hypothetical protein
VAALVACVLTACGSGADSTVDPNASATTPTTGPTTAAPTPSTPGSSPRPNPPPAARPSAPPGPAIPPLPDAPVAGYAGTSAPVDASRLPASWHAGCPVGPSKLRLLALPYIGFDGATHTGEMVVHIDVAERVVGVFKRLYDARYPIQRMVLVDEYGGSDDDSVVANNTSAFNCRAATGGSSWSEHAYGKAIDINPLQNPYVYRDRHVYDPAAAPYVDRSRTDPGVIHAGDVVTQAFAAIGWGWGGNFNTFKDYQHFSASGR